ncbi:MAG: 6,7-dimethyl-8-ribityllumazine synthase [Desulfovibrionaceae bacterium]
MKCIEGNFLPQQHKIAIVASRFNDFIVNKLIEGARDTLIRHGIAESSLTLYKVPGAFEIPLLCQKIASKKSVSGIIALGAVIRGSTPHFDYVCSEVTKGISTISLSHSIPIAFGILTTNTIEQAIERAGTKAGNKGVDAALSIIEMCTLLDSI